MFACIHIPNFFVAAALRAQPEWQMRAVAILEGNPPLEKIVAVSEKAGALGIAPDMTRAQGELCAELVLCPRSPLQESSAHAALLDCARSFSPCVEDAACDTALLDLTGMGSLFGSLQDISRAIAARAAALGLAAHVAVAPNPDAAWLAARGFPGVTVIFPGEEAERLGALPVKTLFRDRLEGEERQSAERMLETLERWGIRNLRALAALPEVALSERLGQQGLHLRQLALGAASRTLVPVEDPLVFEEALELEHPITLLEPLAFLLHRLLHQLCVRLGSRALTTQELRLTLALENFSFPRQRSTFNNRQFFDSETAPRQATIPFCRTLRLPLPMLDVQLFLKLLQLDLNAHPPGAPIVKIHLAAQPARQRSAQGGLFLPPAPEPEKLELTLARIAGLVGEHRVGAVEMLDTHHPAGFRMRRFVTQPTARDSSVARALPSTSSEPVLNLSKVQALPASSLPNNEAQEKQSAIIALRRFRPALRANVTLGNGEPMHVICPGKKEVRGDVLWKAGPWRFSGDWWEREAWSRDEWDVALPGGETLSLFRLVHDLLGGGWFVEGTYD